MIQAAGYSVLHAPATPAMAAGVEPLDDPYRLRRFVDAQDPVVQTVTNELRRGRKQSHWMWFIFPQIAGLGHSAIAREFALESLVAAQAYLAHPLLSQRLIDMTTLVNEIEGKTANAIFGSPDDMKFRSCMTLFALAAAVPQGLRGAAAPETDNHTAARDAIGPFTAGAQASESVFDVALAKYYGGGADPATLSLLGTHDRHAVAAALSPIRSIE